MKLIANYFMTAAADSLFPFFSVRILRLSNDDSCYKHVKACGGNAHLLQKGRTGKLGTWITVAVTCGDENRTRNTKAVKLFGKCISASVKSACTDLYDGHQHQLATKLHLVKSCKILAADDGELRFDVHAI